MGKTKGGFYAVARGHTVGIFNTWDECKAQVNGFTNARYKKFSTENEASTFITENKKGAGPGASIKKLAPITAPICQTETAFVPSSSQTRPGQIFRPLTPGAPAWKKNFKDGIHLNTKVPGRGISTTAQLTAAEFRKRLRVSGDRIVTSKISDGEDNKNADLKKFNVDNDGYVVVYTDGACQANGKYKAKAGVGVWFGTGHNLNVSEVVIGRQTNNTAEIQAAEIAVSQAKKAGIDKLCIKTDSQFVINCITKWMAKWIKNGWKLSDGQYVKNKEDLEKLTKAMKGMEVKWNIYVPTTIFQSYVRGHDGHHGNEEADRLAVEGAKKPRKIRLDMD